MFNPIDLNLHYHCPDATHQMCKNKEAFTLNREPEPMSVTIFRPAPVG